MKNLLILFSALIMSHASIAQYDIYDLAYDVESKEIEDAPSGVMVMTNLGPGKIYHAANGQVYLNYELEDIYYLCQDLLDRFDLDMKHPSTEKTNIDIEEFGIGSDFVYLSIASGHAYCYREWFIDTGDSELETVILLVLDKNDVFFRAYKRKK